jgi:hypothetical protein
VNVVAEKGETANIVLETTVAKNATAPNQLKSQSATKAALLLLSRRTPKMSKLKPKAQRP